MDVNVKNLIVKIFKKKERLIDFKVMLSEDEDSEEYDDDEEILFFLRKSIIKFNKFL